MYKVKTDSGSAFSITYDEKGWHVGKNLVEADICRLDDTTWHLILNGRSFRIQVTAGKSGIKSTEFKVNGNVYGVTVKDKYDLLLKDLGIEKKAAGGAGPVRSPMPGLVLDVSVKTGDIVEKGQSIAILEAMKMENVIKAPGVGKVSEVKVKKGDSVEKDQVLITLK